VSWGLETAAIALQFEEEDLFKLQLLRELINPSCPARSSRAFGGPMKSARRSASGKSGKGGSSGGGNGEGPADPYEQLQYMSDLILQLKRMAEKSGLKDLAGALGQAHDMARHELKSQGGG
jgi:hypothetical protein